MIFFKYKEHSKFSDKIEFKNPFLEQVKYVSCINKGVYFYKFMYDCKSGKGE